MVCGRPSVLHMIQLNVSPYVVESSTWMPYDDRGHAELEAEAGQQAMCRRLGSSYVRSDLPL